MRAAVSAEPRSRPTAVLAIILLSYLMIVLDISIVITALPRLHESLGFSATGRPGSRTPTCSPSAARAAAHPHGHA